LDPDYHDGRTNLNAINSRANAEAKCAASELLLKQKQHLLEELKMGVWTPEEYRKKVRKLDTKKRSKTKEEVKEVTEAPTRDRSYSPAWASDLPSSDY
jgi:vacuolar-type H+-ATPase subunit E/Vma4